ncbi:MAG TPA: DUF4381 domain-containing protein [Thioalkalivibrio sp.]|nr:DUF4381 domain-containing protein [Thioalkalivibrio sp.]
MNAVAITGLLLLAALVVPAVAVWARQPRRRARRRLARLAAIHARDGDRQALLTGLSRLLRDHAQALAGEVAVAGLSGGRWLVFLDETGQTDAFTRGPGRVLVDAPYQSAATLAERDLDIPGLLAACRAWIDDARFHPEHHR